MKKWIVFLMGGILLSLCSCYAPARAPQHMSGKYSVRFTNKPVISSPVAWDIDGDGVKEIAVGSWDGFFYVLDAQLNDVEGWPKYSRNGFFSSPSLTDLDGDGELDIVVGAETGQLFAWHSDGTLVSGYPVDLGYHIWATPLVLEGSRLALGGLENFYLFDAGGSIEPGWPQSMPGWADASAASDGHILAVTTLTPGDPSVGWLSAWTLAGEILPNFPITLSLDSDSSPALASFDGKTTTIIAGDDAGYVHAVDLRGKVRAGFPVRSSGPGAGPTPTPHPPGGNIYSIEASPSIADLDGDGTLEIVVGSWDGQMYVWDASGQLLPGWPVRVRDQIISSAALVDIDDDNQLDIIAGSKDHHLYAWDLYGHTLHGFPFDLGAPVFSSPWVGDLEEDGRADIVVGADNGIHLLRDVGPLGRVGWAMFRGSEQRTGVAQD